MAEDWVPLRDRVTDSTLTREQQSRRAAIEAALIKLPPRLLHIVKRTHGFTGAVQTYEQLGAELSLPPERVAVLERLALDALGNALVQA